MKQEVVLADVPGDKCFWVNNGPVVSNLQQLPGILKEMSNDIFLHHVNSEKNDFATWIREVIGDSQLADQIAKTKKKSAMINVLEKSIVRIKKAGK